jgi:hypothetical protein
MALITVRACEIRAGDKLAVASRPLVTKVITSDKTVHVYAKGRSFKYGSMESVGVEREADSPTVIHLNLLSGG